MAQWVKALTCKSGNLNSIPENYVRWKKERSDSTELSSGLCTCTHTYAS